MIVALIILACLALAAFLTWTSYYIWKAQGGHRCRGHEIGRRFVPGIADRGGKAWGWAAADDNIIRGYTEITYQCNTCGRFFNNIVTGKING